MLTAAYPLNTLRALLLPWEDWHPFPTAADRQPWEALPAEVRDALIARGEEALETDWPPLPATRFLDFARDGNRSRYEGLSFPRRSMLCRWVLAECVEGRGRFVDDLVNGVWAICEESFWGVPAHIGAQRAGSGLPDTAEPIVDLFAAETAALLAWTCYLLGPQLDAVSPLVRPRVHREMDYRILTPLMEREDFGWMGFGGGGRPNNWNPWINSNWLTSALLMEPDPERRLAAVAKSMRSLDCFLDPHPRDGGCDEGPGYWGRAGASVFDCLELLRSATNGRIDLYDQSLVQEIGRFIYRIHLDGEYFVNFADASALVVPPPTVVFGYGKRIGDERLQALGSWLARTPGEVKRESLGRVLAGLFDFPALRSTEAQPPLPRDAWLNEIQVMVARDRAGSPAGLCLAAKGGHNAESHNHNDIGSFVVYADGKPLLIDAGVEAYNRKTFSHQRYEIWTMQSAFHSLLPTVDGIMQAPGGQFAARDVTYSSSDTAAELTLDLAGAYPPEAGLKSWVRTLTFARGEEVRITDRYELSKPVGEIMLGLLTPCEVALGEGEIALRQTAIDDGRQAGSGLVTYGENVEPSVEVLKLEDSRLRAVWGERLSRVVFRVREPGSAGVLAFRVKR
ncbi:MAG: heparinase [Armatimonadetes bacterium CG_4_10_14_3_um_filter_66_18]|nr:heparinase [Armatimonadota bacterium]OIP06506.1 MAG: hypothetical protein AUJ96_08950 [Armatimonadetes bacterium CG2_30_66_41]PIU94349.1 MAG: heparinase [Armatimonadetes bacterium CG06_land_8_20_14_3_00_66_21]PIY44187.1 MAG: heparinase [Armatimonadetes bacterium CG_4_10_14_3_um_filter_66_18]PJB65446.1 MAG: heparinase [Armatimonadetes bacterium CG_4_9_14_3_um_filter_66_14]